MGKGPVQFFQTKVAMALIGAILIGGTSAVLAARTVNEPSVLQTSNALTTNSNSTTSGQLPSATSSTAKPATSSPTAVVVPTVPDSKPTVPPTATPAVGQTVTYSGTVTSVSVGTNTFVLTRNGVQHTIDVNAGTTFTGSATSFSGLQVGMHVQATGNIRQTARALPRRCRATSTISAGWVPFSGGGEARDARR